VERNKFSSARITAERLNYIYPLPWYVNTRTARYCAVKIKYGQESKPRLRFLCDAVQDLLRNGDYQAGLLHLILSARGGKLAAAFGPENLYMA